MLPTEDDPKPARRVEELDFDEDDEAAMDRVWARLRAGETLDQVAETDDDEYEDN